MTVAARHRETVGLGAKHTAVVQTRVTSPTGSSLVEKWPPKLVALSTVPNEMAPLKRGPKWPTKVAEAAVGVAPVVLGHHALRTVRPAVSEQSTPL
jgi:hypothetical protein